MDIVSLKKLNSRRIGSAVLQAVVSIDAAKSRLRTFTSGSVCPSYVCILYVRTATPREGTMYHANIKHGIDDLPSDTWAGPQRGLYDVAPPLYLAGSSVNLE